jgi:hypothetical protein
MRSRLAIVIMLWAGFVALVFSLLPAHSAQVCGTKAQWAEFSETAGYYFKRMQGDAQRWEANGGLYAIIMMDGDKVCALKSGYIDKDGKDVDVP